MAKKQLLPATKLLLPGTDEIKVRLYSQGLGDCFLLASLSAIAAVDPKAIEDAITDHGDGTYSVRFFEKQLRGAATPVGRSPR